MSQLHAPTPQALCCQSVSPLLYCVTSVIQHRMRMPLSRLHDKDLKMRINLKKKTVQETTQLLNYKTVPGKHKWKAYNKALKYLWKEYDPKRKALGCCLQTRSEKQTKYPLRNES